MWRQPGPGDTPAGTASASRHDWLQGDSSLAMRAGRDRHMRHGLFVSSGDAPFVSLHDIHQSATP